MQKQEDEAEFRKQSREFAVQREGKMAPERGLEPLTRRLTAGCSTIELLWNPEAVQSDYRSFWSQRLFEGFVFFEVGAHPIGAVKKKRACPRKASGADWRDQRSTAADWRLRSRNGSRVARAPINRYSGFTATDLGSAAHEKPGSASQANPSTGTRQISPSSPWRSDPERGYRVSHFSTRLRWVLHSFLL